MRLIILSDIHGNYEAARAVVEDALNNYRNQIDGFILLGDYVCDYLEGHEVIKLIKQLKQRYPIYAIKGNRENMAKEYQTKKQAGKALWEIDSTMGAPLLACNRMQKEDFDFLESLPSEEIVQIPNCDPFFMSHRTPLSQDKIKELEEKNINTILIGHTHEKHLGKYQGFTMYNPGAVALSDMGVPGANYGIMTWKNKKWNFESKRVDYNYEKEIQNIKEEPLLFEKCKNWGTALIAAVKTGINVPALYMFEAKRLAGLEQNGELKGTDIDDNFFGNGRYGNVSPFGEPLYEEIYSVNSEGVVELDYQYFKTDEGKPHIGVSISDEIYEQALRNVLSYLENRNQEELETEVYHGRRVR